MNRDKVLELAREANFHAPVSEGEVLRFAALIEREVRGDAEPGAWLPLDEARFALWEAINKRKFGNPTDDKLILEYLKQNGLWIGKNAHPTPAVVRQLVEALEFCRFSLEPYDDIKPRDWKSDRENLRRAHQQAQAALAAAKDAGL